jgi:ABC-2 type transport system permease protein
MRSLWVELIRQGRRRRTVYALSAVVVLPIIIGVVLQITGGPTPDSGQQTLLVDIATAGGPNFALFATSTIGSLLLTVVVALFCGDTVAAEAQWGSLRYLLLRPVPRGQLLSTKLGAGAILSTIAIVLVPLVSLAVGTAFFGWHGLQTPIGGLMPLGQSLRVLALSAGYIGTQMVFVGSVAFWLGTRGDNPLGAVGGAFLLVIVFSILDAITSLGAVRYALPIHYASAYYGLLSSPQQTGDMVRGLALQVPWSIAPLVLAWSGFRRKDVLS